MGSSPPTSEEIFRDYSARRSDAVHSLTNERSSLFCFIPFLSSKKLIAASQTPSLCLAPPHQAPQPLKSWVSKGGVLLNPPHSRFQYSSFGFSSDFTIVNWAATATGYRASYLELALIQFANDISFRSLPSLPLKQSVYNPI